MSSRSLIGGRQGRPPWSSTPRWRRWGSVSAPFICILIGTAAAEVNVLWALLLFALALAPPVNQYVFHRVPRLILGLGLICAVLLGAQSAAPLALLASHIAQAPHHLPFDNDAVAVTSCGTALFVSGINPYTGVDLRRCFWRSGYIHSGSLLTPLRQGRFAHLTTYPSRALLEATWQRLGRQGTGQPREFSWRFSYPAGAFLIPALGWALGLTDLRLFGFLCFAAAYIFLLWRAPRRLWPGIVLLAVTNAMVWIKADSGSSDALSLLLVLVGWNLRRHGVASAVALGLAATARQQAWLFLIFYAVLVLRQEGRAEACQRLAIVGGIFLLTNGPFLWQSPAAWASGVLSPVVEPMFPRGVGLISIFLAAPGLLPLPPQWLFGLFEILALLVCVMLYARVCLRWPHLGLILAVVPLFVAWRSLSSYFFTVSILALGGAVDVAASETAQRLVPLSLRGRRGTSALARTSAPDGAGGV